MFERGGVRNRVENIESGFDWKGDGVIKDSGGERDVEVRDEEMGNGSGWSRWWGGDISSCWRGCNGKVRLYDGGGR